MSTSVIQRLRYEIRGLLEVVNGLPEDPMEKPADVRRIRAKLGAMDTLVEQLENRQR